jgi:hypothetical protein
MVTLRVSISIAELGRRMRQRLSGSDTAIQNQVLWQQDGQRVLLHLESLRVRGVDGWLLCNLDLQTDPTGRQRLQFVFFAGRPGEGDGAQAAASINAPTVGAAQLADRWGPDLQRVLWDSIVDGVEAAVAHVRAQRPTDRLTLDGFTCTQDALHVQVLAGDL